MKDVAAEAGVSAQAVSLVMNEKSKGQLSAATREQVLRAAAKLNESSAVSLSPFPLLIFRHPLEMVMASLKNWLEGKDAGEQCLEMVPVRNRAAARAGLYEGIRQER